MLDCLLNPGRQLNVGKANKASSCLRSVSSLGKPSGLPLHSLTATAAYVAGDTE